MYVFLEILEATAIKKKPFIIQKSEMERKTKAQHAQPVGVQPAYGVQQGDTDDFLSPTSKRILEV